MPPRARRPRRPTSAPAIVLLALALALTTPALAAADTSVVRYQPFTASGEVKSTIRVATTRSNGDCWTGSFTGRSGAWRCMTGHLLYDPCYESPVESLVVCPGHPGGRAVVLRRPSFARQYANDDRTGSIWAVRAGGRMCVAASGARSVVRGKVPIFFCDRTRAVWGNLDRSGATWRALVGSYEDPDGWRWVAVERAWR